MPYIPHTIENTKDMLQSIGAQDTQDLFDEIALYQAPVFLGNGNRLMKCLELESLEYLNKLKIVNNNIIGEDLFINMIKK